MRRCSVCGEKIGCFKTNGKKKLGSVDTLYWRFAINPGELIDYIYDNTQECGSCGYVATNLEDKTGITVDMIYDDVCLCCTVMVSSNPELSRCYRMASGCKHAGCNYTAAQWYCYCGLLCDWTNTKASKILKNKFYREALFLIRKELREVHREKDFELRLAFINVLRLLGMYEECMTEIGLCRKEIDEGRYRCDALDLKILKEIYSLAECSEGFYATYMQIIGEDDSCIMGRKKYECERYKRDTVYDGECSPALMQHLSHNDFIESGQFESEYEDI